MERMKTSFENLCERCFPPQLDDLYKKVAVHLETYVKELEKMNSKNRIFQQSVNDLSQKNRLEMQLKDQFERLKQEVNQQDSSTLDISFWEKMITYGERGFSQQIALENTLNYPDKYDLANETVSLSQQAVVKSVEDLQKDLLEVERLKVEEHKDLSHVSVGNRHFQEIETMELSSYREKYALKQLLQVYIEMRVCVSQVLEKLAHQVVFQYQKREFVPVFEIKEDFDIARCATLDFREQLFLELAQVLKTKKLNLKSLYNQIYTMSIVGSYFQGIPYERLEPTNEDIRKVVQSSRLLWNDTQIEYILNRIYLQNFRALQQPNVKKL